MILAQCHYSGCLDNLNNGKISSVTSGGLLKQWPRLTSINRILSASLSKVSYNQIKQICVYLYT